MVVIFHLFLLAQISQLSVIVSIVVLKPILEFVLFAAHVSLVLVNKMVTVLMCEQVIEATKMGYVNPEGGYGLGYEFIAREFMKDKTAMNKASFEPMFIEAHGKLMQKIIDDGRLHEFNQRMGGAPLNQEVLF